MGEAGLEWLGDCDRVNDLGLSLTRKIVAGGRDHTRAGLYLSHSASFGRSGAVVGRFEVLDQRFDGGSGADGTRARLMGQYRQAVSARLQWRVSAEAETLSAKAAPESFDRVQMAAGLTYGFDRGLILGLDLTRAQVRYDGLSPLFGTARRNDITTIGTQIHNRNLKLRGFAPVQELSHEVGRSSIEVYGYDNTTLSLGLTRAF